MNKYMVSQWFEQYKDDVYHYLVYYTGKRDVEDLVQEVFISCIKSKKLYKVTQPKSWLIRIARNVAINEHRKQRSMRWIPEFIMDRFPSPVKTPEERIQLEGDLQEIYAALNQLKQSYREVILLREIQGLSVDETATILDWDSAKVSLTLHRALKKLREKFQATEGSEYYENRTESG